MLTPPKRPRLLVPLHPTRRACGLTGTLSGTQHSATVRVTGVRVTLRIRTSADVVVDVRRRRLTRWVVTTYAGNDIQHLLSRAVGEDLQLRVTGTAPGTVELVY